jgi:hypothetical protein
MNKVNNILILNIIFALCFISLSCKAQVEIIKEPSAEIIDAFYSNDTTLMADYIKKGKYPIGYRPDNRISPIESTIWNNRADIVMFLVNNAGFKITNEDIYSMLDRENFNIDAFNSLLSITNNKTKIDITEWSEKYINERQEEYPKGILISRDYYTRLKLIVIYGFDLINLVDPETRTEFYISVIKYEDWKLLDLLDYKDEAFNGHTCYGPTVLTSAVYSRKYDLVKYLLDKGLDKTVRMFDACYDDAQEGQNAYEIVKDLGDKALIDLLK